MTSSSETLSGPSPNSDDGLDAPGPLGLMIWHGPNGPTFSLTDSEGRVLPGQTKVEVTCVEHAPTKVVVTFLLPEGGIYAHGPGIEAR